MKILLLLLFLDTSAVVAKVVTDFTSTCPNFFATPNGKITPPTVFSGSQYRQICQKQAKQNVYEFATLYDTQNRIPVYSAYVYISQRKCKRKTTWYIEPQLDDQNTGPDMQPDTATTLRKPPRGNNQALNEDYVKSGFDRGHLYPVFYTNTQSCADSTFTLTNAAPQDPSFNRGQWKVMERNLVKILKDRCFSHKTYVVTGVVPNTTGEFINGRVNVPSHFWNAYCCLDNNDKAIASNGYLAPNSNVTPSEMSVSNLENELSNHYGSKFVLFDETCRRHSGTPVHILDLAILDSHIMLDDALGLEVQ